MWNNKENLILVVIWVAFVMFGCTYMRERTAEVLSTPDNIVEELAEELIEAKLGIDIDLTPGTPEK